MKVWITRAEPGAQATGARLKALGYEPVIAPLLAVRCLSVSVDLAGVDALAFTSRNAVAAFASLTPDRRLPVFAVGDATADAARAAGFAAVRSAAGDLRALAALIRAEAAGRTVLNPVAAEPAGDLAALVVPYSTVRALPVYETSETSVRPPPDWDVVLIYSPRAAGALLASRAAAAGRAAVAISEAAAQPLRTLPFRTLRIADRPTEDALLSALGNPDPDV